ncbi:MAG: CcmD family protein [Bacteroidota bacterium]
MQLPITPTDSTEAPGTAVYDSVWAALPEAAPVGLEAVMLQQDKLYVVLAVVLIIWFGVLFFLLRTDRRLARIEQDLDARPEREDTVGT